MTMFLIGLWVGATVGALAVALFAAVSRHGFIEEAAQAAAAGRGFPTHSERPRS